MLFIRHLLVFSIFSGCIKSILVVHWNLWLNIGRYLLFISFILLIFLEVCTLIVWDLKTLFEDFKLCMLGPDLKINCDYINQGQFQSCWPLSLIVFLPDSLNILLLFDMRGRSPSTTSSLGLSISAIVSSIGL